ncbi:MAG: thiol oxidoreductase, partial [Lentisphaeraceae bacterium]|nr:thiol oxidoreductase [Lentisphaeraceae bacterium]
MKVLVTFLLLTQSVIFAARQSANSGGELTIFNTSKRAFGMNAPNMPVEKLRDFAFGNKIFNVNWTTAPGSVKTLDGLGPFFNRVACSQCHLRDGRGKAPENRDEFMDSMLIRVSKAGRGKHGGPLGHSIYGGQISDRAIHGLKPEARVRVSWNEVSGKYADGENYTLRQPTYEFEFNYGKPGDDFLFSPRVTPAVFGLGLLEALDESTILANEDIGDADGDGISGKANYAWDAVNNKRSLGRFGWKAAVPTLRHQNAGAAVGDIGITTELFSGENSSLQESQKADFSKDADMSNKQLDKLTFYISSLAVPARRDVDDAQVQLGEKIFKNINCTSCHTPAYKTGSFHQISLLRNQQIQPFTDLLVHDMGDALADNRADFMANGREWRTAPLWGLGLHKMVNGNDFFLHDGRARSIEEAILWHGGEAKAS